jgi:hypothetical protein
MARTFALALCLILAIVAACLGEQPPSPRPASAPLNSFSAERAMADVRVIARAPHPTGSPANAAVRDHLLRRMTALGLDPAVHAQVGLEELRLGGRVLVMGGRPETLVGVLPGRDRNQPAIALMAHYDSVPASPGAADDAAGVAAILEAVRALKAEPPLRRDVVVILTDGEETGLLGARAFFASHPLARRIGFVTNLEARGGGGRARMFQTGSMNGETVALFGQAVGRPSASSLAAFLYDMMPNDTDFTVARAAGRQGLNFAFLGRQFDYHSPSSTPANLDQGSLQDLGAQALAAARAAADAPALPRPVPDRVFNQLPMGPLVVYPAPMGGLLIAASAVLLAWAGMRARRRGRLTWPDVARGAGAGLFLALAGATLLRAMRNGAGAGFGELEQRRLLAQAAPFEAALVLAGLGLLLYTAAELARGRRGVLIVPAAAGLAGAFVAGFDPVCLVTGALACLLGTFTLRRPVEAPGAWAGLLATGFGAAVVVQALAPLAAPLIAWPLLAAAAGAAATALWTRRPIWARLIVAAAATAALAWLGGFVHGLYLGLDRPELLALPLWIAAMVIWPLAQPEAKGAGTPFVSVSLLLAGLAVFAYVRFADPWSPRFPQPSQVVYLMDQAGKSAFRLSLTPGRPAWAEAVLRADGGEIRPRPAPMLAIGSVDAAAAPPVDVPAPAFAAAPGEAGRITLRVTPPPGARYLALDYTADAPIEAVSIAGRPSSMLSQPHSSGHIRWRGETDALEISFKSREASALAVRYGVLTPDWPASAGPLPPRPLEVAPYGDSDATFVTGRERLTWPATSAKPAP